MREKITVLDFGGQYTQLIAKTIRKCSVFSEIRPHDTRLEDIVRENPRGVILSGGPQSVYEKEAPKVNPALFDAEIPILGICYGMQHINHSLMNRHWLNRTHNHFFGDGILHGEDTVKEYGETQVNVDNFNPLFFGLEDNITAWMSHGDSVDRQRLAKGFKVIAETKDHVAAIANDKKLIYGVQFHPEVTHTEGGADIISNFVHGICKCGKEWVPSSYISESKEYIKKIVENNNILCLASGGVDSSYTAKLLSDTEGIGNVYVVYIGALMRKGENEEVLESYRKAGIKNVTFIDAEERFIEAVKGMQDPEQKRKAIGNLFGQIQQEACEKLGINPNKTYLAQGTLYTDLIESGKGVGKKADTIKSHHNVGCKFIEDMKAKGLVVEPNRLIFKDEVREAAREIGLPLEISERQPFPGPGLGIRIVDGKQEWINEGFYETNNRVKRIALEEGLEGYALPIKTVGVQGDGRTYSYLALLRGERDWQKIRKTAARIPKEVNDINRLVYDLSQNNSPVDISSLIPTKVSRETIELLKDVDFEGRGIIKKHGFESLDNISQTIFVLFGADIYKSDRRSVALRAVSTDDFMTVRPVKISDKTLSWKCLDEIRDTITKKYAVGALVYDITDKPPATTCWE